MNIVAKVGPHEVEESCGYYYPTFNGNLEFRTLRECKAFILFNYMPMLRLFAFTDKNIFTMIQFLELT